jgi:hypothetical protein
VHVIQVAEYRYEIERLNRELMDLKRRYFEAKRREQLEREATRSGNGAGVSMQSQASTRPASPGGIKVGTTAPMVVSSVK